MTTIALEDIMIMKKLISICLSICLILSAFSIVVSADGYASDVQSELIELACIAFPEYSDTILNPVVPNPSARSSNKPIIAYTEARKIDDHTCMIYTRYDDDSVFLTSVEGDDLEVAALRNDWTEDLDKPPVTQITKDSIVTTTTSKKHTINIKGTHPGVNGYFMITDFCYTLFDKGYDRITSTGTRSWTGDWKACSLYGQRLSETSTASASALFRATYQYGSGAYYSRQTELFVQVGHDTMTFSHENFL